MDDKNHDIDLTEVVDTVKKASAAELKILSEISAKLSGRLVTGGRVAKPRRPAARRVPPSRTRDAAARARRGEVELKPVTRTPLNSVPEIVQGTAGLPVSVPQVRPDGAAGVTSVSSLLNEQEAKQAAKQDPKSLPQPVEPVSVTVKTDNDALESSMAQASDAIDGAMNAFSDYWKDERGRLRLGNGKFASKEQRAAYEQTAAGVAKERESLKSGEKKKENEKGILASLVNVIKTTTGKALDAAEDKDITDATGAAAGGSFFYSAKEMYKLAGQIGEIKEKTVEAKDGALAKMKGLKGKWFGGKDKDAPASSEEASQPVAKAIAPAADKPDALSAAKEQSAEKKDTQLLAEQTEEQKQSNDKIIKLLTEICDKTGNNGDGGGLLDSLADLNSLRRRGGGGARGSSKQKGQKGTKGKAPKGGKTKLPKKSIFKSVLAGGGKALGAIGAIAGIGIGATSILGGDAPDAPASKDKPAAKNTPRADTPTTLDKPQSETSRTGKNDTDKPKATTADAPQSATKAADAADASKPKATTADAPQTATKAAKTPPAKKGLSMSGKAYKGVSAAAKGMGKVVPFIAPLLAAYDAFDGFTNVEAQQEAFDLKEGEEASLGQKSSMAAANLLDMGGLVSGGAGLIGSALGFMGFDGAKEAMTFDAGDIAKGIFSLFGGGKDKKEEEKKADAAEVKPVTADEAAAAAAAASVMSLPANSAEAAKGASGQSASASNDTPILGEETAQLATAAIATGVASADLSTSSTNAIEASSQLNAASGDTAEASASLIAASTKINDAASKQKALFSVSPEGMPLFSSLGKAEVNGQMAPISAASPSAGVNPPAAIGKDGVPTSIMRAPENNESISQIHAAQSQKALKDSTGAQLVTLDQQSISALTSKAQPSVTNNTTTNNNTTVKAASHGNVGVIPMNFSDRALQRQSADLE